MKGKKENPANRSRAGGARDASRRAARSEPTTGKPKKASLTVRLGDQTLTLSGRLAQTLLLLIQKGPRGVTSGEASPLGWARRTSAYVGKLRKRGFVIVTIYERTDDARIGRYVLVSPVAVVSEGGGL